MRDGRKGVRVVVMSTTCLGICDDVNECPALICVGIFFKFDRCFYIFMFRSPSRRRRRRIRSDA